MPATKLRFVTLTQNEAIPTSGVNLIVLGYDSWDDWFEFETTYNVFYYDGNASRSHLGQIKIGQYQQSGRRAALPREFSELDDTFFSIGLGEDYYKAVNDTGRGAEILRSLKDMAFDLEVYDRYRSEKVARISLFRTVDAERVKNQFHRLSQGDVELTEYAFSYVLDPGSKDDEGASLQFKVLPHSNPPSNVHVLIGRNGVGKTTCLNDLAQAFIELPISESASEAILPNNRLSISSAKGGGSFANLISVTFSAFDPFFPESRETHGRYAYVGLKEGLSKEALRASAEAGIAFKIKGPDDLTADFIRSGARCLEGLKLARWRRTLQNLASDPIFEESEIVELSEDWADIEEWRHEAARVFRRLSSGHKIVLLTVTRLVELVQEQSLVLLDEPEGHLHPPLLSAFIRTLSELLTHQNGVAIVATHSPVVLQEVPRSCVWILDRSGNSVRARRPIPETFGENVGQLTHEVFQLEVLETGFYEMLRQAAVELGEYDAVLARFDGQLGSEARAMLNTLLPRAVERTR